MHRSIHPCMHVGALGRVTRAVLETARHHPIPYREELKWNERVTSSPWAPYRGVLIFKLMPMAT